MGPTHTAPPRARIIGPGRLGRSLAAALTAAGSPVEPLLGRTEDVTRAAAGVDVLFITTPDDHVGDVAAAVRPEPTTVVAHCSGSLSLEVLAPHPRRASFHPLVSIPDPSIGAARLRDGAACALDGDRGIDAVADALGVRAFRVDPDHRVEYHAAAVVASNHLVALLGQVERIASVAGVPLDAYLDLAGQTLDNVRRVGPGAALTGPMARGDWRTVSEHLETLDEAERPAYASLALEALRLRRRSADRDGAEEGTS